ncbi:phosphopyruvate hydratase [Euryarchaeota archaeon]|nr:phosphopyruvate hydratase [Euryarchaeota archaeon]
MGDTISDLRGRMVIDSRGNPTVEVDVFVNNQMAGRAIVPSGASTGVHEALELRDGDKSRWVGKGVDAAVANVNGPIRDLLIGMDVGDQATLDASMIDADGTTNKSKFGANAILGASMASLKAAANLANEPLWKHIAGSGDVSLPVPMMNILNGGSHANSNVDVQEFMVVPHGFDDFTTAFRAGVECYHALKGALKQDGLLGGVGDEGGFAPNLPANEEGLSYMVKAIEGAGYSTDQIGIALDCAASEFYRDEAYQIDGQAISGEALGELYSAWLDDYPILSIEDGFHEDDWASWESFTKRDGGRCQVVGDDLFVTQRARLQQGIDAGSANSILIKLNQIGSVTETLETMQTAWDSGFTTVVSHRSGETEDTTIADLAVGTNAGQIKTGAPCRTDRVAKYNQLLRICEHVGDYASPFY